MSIGTILLIVLVLILFGVLPVWPRARSWSYGPSGIVGVIVAILMVICGTHQREGCGDVLTLSLALRKSSYCDYSANV